MAALLSIYSLRFHSGLCFLVLSLCDYAESAPPCMTLVTSRSSMEGPRRLQQMIHALVFVCYLMTASHLAT